MNEEQDIVGDQTAPSKDLHCKEVDPSQDRQMRLNEFLPRRILAHSFIKSPCGSGLPMGDQRSERDRDDAGRAPASIWNSAHRKVSEKGDRVARIEAACDRIYAAAAQVYR